METREQPWGALHCGAQSSLFRNGNPSGSFTFAIVTTLNLPYLGMETTFFGDSLCHRCNTQSSLFRNGNVSTSGAWCTGRFLNLPYLGMETFIISWKMALKRILNLPYLGMETNFLTIQKTALENSIFLI